jgi:tetratricopeptide (TPR) repeat protein
MTKWLLLSASTVLVTGLVVNQANHPPKAPDVRSYLAARQAQAVLCSPGWQQWGADSSQPAIPALSGWGSYRWNIASKADSANYFFNQGINLYYGFHIIEALASFKRAQTFDPEQPLLYWAEALAYGPNINDMEYAASPEALHAVRRAESLKEHTDDLGKALIDAMAVRYSADSTQSRNQLNLAYAASMKKAMQLNPASADVRALYADALMIQHPWNYWQHNGTAQPWTNEIISVLETGLAAHPEHPGLNHYYIHMVEASPNPEKGLAAAGRLETLMPAVAHMTHMPSHIYIRTGKYQQGIQVNNTAIDGYRAYQQLYAPVSGNKGLYEVHNLHMKAACALQLASYNLAVRTATECRNSIDTAFLFAPPPFGNLAQYYYETPLQAMLQFEAWSDILKQPMPEKRLAFSYALYCFAKGLANSKTGQVAEAQQYLLELKQRMKDSTLRIPVHPFNSAHDQLNIAVNWLQAAIWESKKQLPLAISSMKKAVAAEDNLIYNEPRDWLVSTRTSLAQLYRKAGKLNDAERTLLEELKIMPNNERSLQLLHTLYEQMPGKEKELEQIGMKIKEAAM